MGAMGLWGWSTRDRPAAKNSSEDTSGSRALWWTRILEMAARGRVP